jgi:hypothetical protein
MEIQIPDTAHSDPADEAARQYMMRGLVEPETFGRAIGNGVSGRQVGRWIQEGLPVVYYGRKPFVVIEPAKEWLIARGRQFKESPT